MWTLVSYDWIWQNFYTTLWLKKVWYLLILMIITFLAHLTQRVMCAIVITLPSSSVNFSHLSLLLWNHWDNWNQSSKNWSLECSLQSCMVYANRKSKMVAVTLINIGSYAKMFKCLLIRSYESDWNQTVHECSLDGSLQSLGVLFSFQIQDGC